MKLSRKTKTGVTAAFNRKLWEEEKFLYFLNAEGTKTDDESGYVGTENFSKVIHKVNIKL